MSWLHSWRPLSFGHLLPSISHLGMFLQTLPVHRESAGEMRGVLVSPDTIATGITSHGYTSMPTGQVPKPCLWAGHQLLLKLASPFAKCKSGRIHSQGDLYEPGMGAQSLVAKGPSGMPTAVHQDPGGRLLSCISRRSKRGASIALRFGSRRMVATTKWPMTALPAQSCPWVLCQTTSKLAGHVAKRKTRHAQPQRRNSSKRRHTGDQPQGL
ncbi:unnamed protein product [Ostreobium quekettii]|uniref:Uncharacterized protein n=1 Tax=Ostreobium quekettii TaxID=121088 RepID=A0A8S1J2Q3_9CHLO|nr:unnamed protein product [Ostreobium quekettii]